MVTTSIPEEQQMQPNPITNLVASEHRRELREAADRNQRARGDRGWEDGDGRITIRYARASDAKSLVLLAELDSGEAPRGAALVAEVDGQPRAALPLDGSPPIADPFRATAELLALLRLRAAQLVPGAHR
jgi:hypothetical protein